MSGAHDAVAAMFLHDFVRRMARYEVRRARDMRAAGRPDRAAVALQRARLWRENSAASAKGGAA